MKKQIDKDKPIGKLKIVKDVLPHPEELVQAEDTQKITISLNKSSIKFFKQLAHKNKTKYQPLIRKLIEKYVERYSH